jgi:hypothetical protein
MPKVPVRAALVSLATIALAAPALAAQPTFEEDVAFLRQRRDVVVLGDAGGPRVAVVPAWQGRVATSTVGGPNAPSYGWINRELAASGDLLPHMNAFGGEDRLWLGPEGGQYSIFFKKGDPFDLEHWQTPALFDSEPWSISSQTPRQVLFEREDRLVNYSGTRFDIRLVRTVRLVERAAAEKALGAPLSAGLKLVAFESENVLVNAGKTAWAKMDGLLSIWILGMFQPTPATTIVIPFREGPESALGPVVNDAYFGKVPAERLRANQGLLFFKGDGEYRSKIGLSPRRATGLAASWDKARGVLTFVRYDRALGATDYVNSMWEIQKEPFKGDVVNSYNDGPPEPGKRPLGPFYELESSSPAEAILPRGLVRHTHRTFHVQGPHAELDALAQRLLGVSLSTIEAALASGGSR